LEDRARTAFAVPRLKVALVDLDNKPVPAWVPETLAAEGIELVIGDSRTRDELARHAADADVVWLFGGSRILMEGNLAAVPRCWAILRTGSGTDNVPIEEATRRGIVVANTPAAFSDAVSDHVIALLFSVVRRVAALDREVRRGRWSHAGAQPLATVQGRTLGLVGFGHIAREVARKLSGFDLRVLAHDPYLPEATIEAHGASAVSLDALLAQSDFVSLHCPLTPTTRHLIGEAQFRLMKRSAIVINTSRGAVMDEHALVAALAEGRIAAAGLDVVEAEPPAADSPLLALENVVLTPHCAGLSATGVEVRWRASLEAVRALAERRWPPSPVNRTVKPRQPLEG
jgi:D-3-phosphoglycerate dehydrogenase / 2-oxoglutarate reductase